MMSGAAQPDLFSATIPPMDPEKRELSVTMAQGGGAETVRGASQAGTQHGKGGSRTSVGLVGIIDAPL